MKKMLHILFPNTRVPRPHDDALRANQYDDRPFIVSPWVIR